MRKIIDKGLELSLIFLMAFLVVDVLWQVLSRYILVSPSSVTDELQGLCIAWVDRHRLRAVGLVELDRKSVV